MYRMLSNEKNFLTRLVSSLSKVEYLHVVMMYYFLNRHDI